MKKNAYAILIFLSFSFISHSSSAQFFNWAKSFGSIWVDEVYDITSDDSGNVYTIGRYGGSADFDPGPGFQYQLPFGNANGYDIFISKFDKNGYFQWVRTLGGTLDDYALGISVDHSQQLLITGRFSGSVDFDGSAGVFMMTAGFDVSAFLLKLSPQGDFIWAKQFDGYSTQATDIITDSTNDIFITGQYTASMDADPGPNVYPLTSNLFPNHNLFVCKLDSNGQFVWAKDVKSTGCSTDKIRLDHMGNILISGVFSDTTDFDPGVGIYEMSTNGLTDLFILKLNPIGNFIWCKSTQGSAGTSQVIGKGLEIDQNNNVYSTGFFNSTVDFDPSNTTNSYTSMGNTDIYVLKLDANGNFGWVNTYGSTNNDKGTSLCIDQQQNVYFGSTILGSIDFDLGPAVFQVNLSNVWLAVITKLDTNGQFQNAISFAPGVQTILHGLNKDIENNLLVGGTFHGSTDFDPGNAVYNLTANGAYMESFLMKLSQCQPSYSIITDTACNGALSPSGNYYWTYAGTYYDFLTNANGCDSIIEFHLVNNTNSNTTIFTLYACDSLVSPSGLHTWYTSGTYTDTLVSTYGCDSILTINLTIKQSSSTTLNQNSCAPFTLNNQTYTSSGTYIQQFMNAVGCDSSVILNLQIGSVVNSSATQTVCDSFLFNNVSIYNSGNYIDTFQSVLGCDSIVNLNLNILHSTSQQISVNACDSLTLNGYTYTTSGTYIQNLTNNAGCDSTLTIVLNLNTSPNASISINGNLLTSVNTALSYQWLQCPGFIPIVGSTSSTYAPNTSGNYALLLSNGNCVDTSSCIPFILSDINEKNRDEHLSIYPNPFSEKLNIKAMTYQKEYIIELYNSLGQIVLKENLSNLPTNYINTDFLPSGIYTLKISFENTSSFKKLIKFMQ